MRRKFFAESISNQKNQPFSYFNNKFHKETTENQLGHEKHLLLLGVFKRHQLLEEKSSTIPYGMQLHRPCAHLPLHFITLCREREVH